MAQAGFRTNGQDVQATIGMVLALLVFIGLGLWLSGAALRTVHERGEVRQATVAGMGIATVVGRLDGAGGATPEVLAAALETYRETAGGIVGLRVLRWDGARLLLSTHAEDAEIGTLPRRLTRPEKPFFDRMADLRANIDSNSAEGLTRLEEIAIRGVAATADRPAVLRVTVPVVADDRFWGVVEVERARTPLPVGTPVGTFLLAGCLGIAVFLAGVYGRARSLLGPAFPFVLNLSKRRYLVAAGLLLVSSIWLFVQGRAVDRVEDLGRSTWQEIAATVDANRTAAAATLRLSGLSLPPGARFDVDAFRRPAADCRTVDCTDAEERADRSTSFAARDERSLESALRWTGLLAVAVFAVFAMGWAARLKQTVVAHRTAYWYVLPAMAGMLLLVFFPLLFGVMLSFTERTLVNQSVPIFDLWVGLENYARILGDWNVLRSTPDGWVLNYESFYWTLFITVVWTVTNVALGVTIGMALALALNTEGLRGKAIYRVLLILPWAIPNYITALTWKGMFHPQFGVINQAIVLLGGGEPVAWYDSVPTAFLTGLATNAWLSFPFMMVVCLGALQSIPADMYEAAKLEGASRWQQFRHITLPLLQPALIPAVILSVVWTFNMFNVIYLVSGGAPAGANEILITKAFKLAFERYQYGYAAAYSMVIFFILLAYGVFQNRATRATDTVR